MLSNTSNRIAMIDWFKAIGIFLIVFGHLDGNFTNTLTTPVLLKQLGVVFFIFIMGWQLAQETRSRKVVLFNRLFKICFWGISFALVLSLIKFVFIRDINKSNYLPFFFGINVVLNYFPANPTTWFIGTYFHLLLLWAFVLKKISVTKRIIFLSIILEIVARGILMNYGFLRAYMLFFNWQTVFLIGIFFGQGVKKTHKEKNHLAQSILIYAGFIIVWAVGSKLFTFFKIFPFDVVLNSDGERMLFVTSFLISFVYIGHALLFFNVARRLPNNKIIEFFSRNTLIIFIVHMPVWYFIAPYMANLIPWHPLRLIADLGILFVGIGIFSFVLEKIIPWKKCKIIIQSRLIG